MKNLTSSVIYKNQTGAALITSLVFMGILTMLGVSAMRSNTLDMKIHNAMKNRLTAFQCAESALRKGERYIDESPTELEGTLAKPDQANYEVWSEDITQVNNMVNKAESWWIINGWTDWELNSAEVDLGCAKQAVYIVQSLGGVGLGANKDLSFDAQSSKQMSGYRISSRSAGLSDDSTVILQSVFIRKFR